jgi:hypothetical protein
MVLLEIARVEPTLIENPNIGDCNLVRSVLHFTQ